MIDKSFLTKPVHEEGDKDNFPLDAITDPDEVEEMFEQAFNHFPDSDFLKDVYNWWEDKGFITLKQHAAVKKIADRE